MLSQIIGRLHILLLHLPIGILLLAVLLEWIQHWKLVLVPKQVRTLIYGFGALSALLASVTGYLLSESGDYTEAMVNNHMWAGFVSTLVSFIICWLSYKNNFKNLRWLSLLMMVSISVTGHLGGTITHGEGFITNFSDNNNKLAAGPVFNISNIEDARLYPDLVHPILKAKCVNCHGPSKKKGKLRLDEEAFIRKGGKSGKMLIGGRPAESELLHRIQLPLNDEDHMPPKKKIQMSKDEISLLNWWISNGNDFGSPLQELSATDSIYKLVEQIIEDSKQVASGEPSDVVPAFLPAAELKIPSEKVLEDLASLNIVALKAGAESPFLELNFVNLKKVDDRHWEIINKIALHIVRLKMSGLNIDDDGLTHISGMKNLLRLHLDQTQITDVGMGHLSSLSQLRYLNINETAVSNKGLESLKELKNLKSIYAYKTEVDLDKLDNGATIITGGYSLPFYETDTIRIPEN